MQINLNYLSLLRTYVILLIGILFTNLAFAGTIKLAWQASASSIAGGYIVSYGTASKTYTNDVDAGNSSSYVLQNLQEGVTYFIAVKAYSADRSVQSAYSNEVIATIAPPQTATLNADFSADKISGTAPMLVSFTGSSTGNITSWKWNFGDTSIPSATSQNATVTFNTPGTYDVSLNVTDSNNQTYTALKSKFITVNYAPPVANFTTTGVSGSAPLSASFSDTSTGNITSRLWNFGDGTTETGTNPTHIYSTAGVYTVSLTVTGPGGSNTKTSNGLVNVLSPPGTGNTGTDPTANLVAAYAFDESGTAAVADASGKGNHGEVIGALKSTGKFGKALNYDGVDDVFTVADSASLDLSKELTIEAWVYPQAVKRSSIVAKNMLYGSAYDLYAYEDYDLPVANFHNGTTYQWIHGVNQLSINTWAHVATTFDGVNQRLYVNGVQVSIKPQLGPVINTELNLNIGGNSAWGENFKGVIDEVRIYNRALSAEQIVADMNKSISDQKPVVYTFGNTSQETSVYTIKGGMGVAYQALPGKTNVTSQTLVYLNTGTTAKQIEVAIYSDNMGHPGQRLTRGVLDSPKPGSTNVVNLQAIKLTAGIPYWIAVMGKSGDINIRTRNNSNGALMENSSSSTLTRLPFAWSTGSKLSNGPISMFGKGYN